jgi:hypothetical protein
MKQLWKSTRGQKNKLLLETIQDPVLAGFKTTERSTNIEWKLVNVITCKLIIWLMLSN